MDTEKFSKYLLANRVHFALFDKSRGGGYSRQKMENGFLYFYSFIYLEYSTEDRGGKTMAQSYAKTPPVSLTLQLPEV